MRTTSRRIGAVVALALVIAGSTWAVGWSAVPIVALLAGAALARLRGVPALTAAGATLGWALLLLLAAARGDAAAFARQLSEILGVHWAVVVIVTLLFPALLAWSAARVAQSVVQTMASRRRATG